jgi:hypothetical protein
MRYIIRTISNSVAYLLNRIRPGWSTAKRSLSLSPYSATTLATNAGKLARASVGDHAGGRLSGRIDELSEIRVLSYENSPLADGSFNDGFIVRAG